MSEGDGMGYSAPATEADMARARDLLHPLDEGKPFSYQERMKYTDREFTMIQIIADALAIEREKARAPFREIVEQHAWGEEDPLAVRDELLRALREES